MCIKATIVAYAFSVECFENTTIVVYAGLKVNTSLKNIIKNEYKSFEYSSSLSAFHTDWLVSTTLQERVVMALVYKDKCKTMKGNVLFKLYITTPACSLC